MLDRLNRWLEFHWVTPAYGGLLLSALSLFFFAAATNTLAGWLYVISGVIFALLMVAAVLPGRSLRGLQVSRPPIYPVSVGNALTIEVWVENSTNQPKNLVQVTDVLPYRLGEPVKAPIETIPPKETYRWLYTQPTQNRGVYRWQTVELRTASPLGLFWCRRSRTAKTKAVVYPLVLSLTQSPLVDEMGKEDNPQLYSQHRAQAATEGLTRALRPYRWGDPIRLIHWRSSARYGELRVRELEVFTGGQEIVIALDSAATWERGTAEAIAGIPNDPFEQAVIAAASLYFYTVRQNLPVRLWTAGSGLVQGELPVLEALAATYAGEDVLTEALPDLPMVWLTQNSQSLNTLPMGSRWVLWPSGTQTADSAAGGVMKICPGLMIRPDQPLQIQLQAPLR